MLALRTKYPDMFVNIATWLVAAVVSVVLSAFWISFVYKVLLNYIR